MQAQKCTMSSSSGYDLASLDTLSSSPEMAGSGVASDDGKHNIEMLKFSQNELKLMWEDSDLFDITLEVGLQSIQAHKVVLAAHCSYFKAMFCGKFQDAQKKSVALNG